MCTVSLIPANGAFIITSNRDERLSRPLAYSPALEQINGKWMLFPKDPLAGGTWFAADEEGTVAVLLNGAFKAHRPGGTYKRSRGLVLLDILSSAGPFHAFEACDLNGIEPFTLLLYKGGRLAVHRWDGTGKTQQALACDIPRIYSSVTLYPEAVIKQRETWFGDFLKAGDISPESVRAFHTGAGSADPPNALVMHRNGTLRTQSITQTIVRDSHIDFYHHDLINDSVHSSSMPITPKPGNKI